MIEVSHCYLNRELEEGCFIKQRFYQTENKESGLGVEEGWGDVRGGGWGDDVGGGGQGKDRRSSRNLN